MLTGKDWIFAPLVASMLSDDDDERDQIVKELIDDEGAKRMKILYKSPGMAPEVKEIENDLKVLQELVGGYIETVRFNGITMIINEEGKLKGLPVNFLMVGNGCAQAIVGPVIFCRSEGVDFTSLKDEDIEMIQEVLI